jgi:hypothetical protein
MELNRQMCRIGGSVDLPAPTCVAEIEILKKYGKLLEMPCPHPALTESKYLASLGKSKDEVPEEELRIRRVIQERYEQYLAALL